MDLLGAVRNSLVLSELTDDELKRLALSLDMVDFPQGGKLFEQDEEGDSLYIIVSGQVGVIRWTAKEKTNRKERLLAVVGTGECIGEMALADGGPRSATVQTLEDVSALRLTRENYDEIRDGDPGLATKLSLGIFKLLSRRLRQINKSLEIVHYWMFA